jgi:acetoin utilization protein AcuB
MVRSPHTIGVDQTLELASHRMAELGIRHLPVLDGGQLVGIISERDIALVASVAPTQVTTIKVEEAMAGVPYCVEADTPVATVAHHMALRKLGSAIVTEQGKVAGVFTTTDALEVLFRVLDGDADDDRDGNAA